LHHQPCSLPRLRVKCHAPYAHPDQHDHGGGDPRNWQPPPRSAILVPASCAGPAERGSHRWRIPDVSCKPGQGSRHLAQLVGCFVCFESGTKAADSLVDRTVVKSMVSGHPSGAQRGHHTMAGCIAEWQEHCALGVHPHPAALEEMASATTPVVRPRVARRPAAIQETAGPSKSRGRPVAPELQTQLYVSIFR
jgi:hypothetical protein